MIYLAAAYMGTLLVVTRICFGSLLAPAVLYSSIWFASLSVVAICGDIFYRLDHTALGIYVVGATAYSLGAFAAAALPMAHRPSSALTSQQGLQIQRVLSAITLFLLAALPFYLMQLFAEVGTPTNWLFLQLIRLEEVEASGAANEFSLTRNVPLLASFVGMSTLYFGDDGSRRRLAIAGALILWLFTGILTGSKLVFVYLPVSVAVLLWLKDGAPPIKWMVAGAILLLAGSVGGIWIINYGYLIEADDGLGWGELLRIASAYALGGVVAFNWAVEAPTMVSTSQPPLWALETVINGVAVTLGWTAPFELSSWHADYVPLGPEMGDTNVYTTYFSYYKGMGWTGVMTWPLAAGFLGHWIYRLARRGSYVASIVYVYVVIAALLSVFAENFFGAVSTITKAVVFCLLVLAAARIRISTKGIPAGVAPK